MKQFYYQYLRADLEEIDIGPFNTFEQAENDMNDYRQLTGALVQSPFEMEKGQELYKD